MFCFFSLFPLSHQSIPLSSNQAPFPPINPSSNQSNRLSLQSKPSSNQSTPIPTYQSLLQPSKPFPSSMPFFYHHPLPQIYPLFPPPTHHQIPFLPSSKPFQSINSHFNQTKLSASTNPLFRHLSPSSPSNPLTVRPTSTIAPYLFAKITPCCACSDTVIGTFGCKGASTL